MQAILAALLFVCLTVTGAVGANRSFGDSLTAGVNATPASNGWAPLVWAQLGLPYTNYGVNNTMVADMATTVYPINIADGDISTVMIGGNDERILQNDPVKREFFKLGLKDQIAWLALINKKKGTTAALTGSWSPTVAYGIGMVSGTPGSTAIFENVSGTVIFVSMAYQNVNGTYDILIDGVKVGSGSTYAAGITTPGGKSYGPMLYQFPVAAGLHTVQIAVTSGPYVYVEWVAGNDQPALPPVYVLNIIRASNYTFGGSDAIVDDYNANAVAPAVAELAAAGLNVKLINAHDALNSTTDMGPDYHPNNSGYAKIAAVAYAAMSGPPPLYSFEPVQVYHRLTSGVPDGTLWIDDGEQRKQLATVP